MQETNTIARWCGRHGLRRTQAGTITLEDGLAVIERDAREGFRLRAAHGQTLAVASDLLALLDAVDAGLLSSPAGFSPAPPLP